MMPEARPRVAAVLLKWHGEQRSEAAHDALLHPLADSLDFTVFGVEWGQSPPLSQLAGRFDAVVFLQTQPPARLVRELACPVTWIPMWDSVRARPDSWWRRLPSALRIVAFSDQIARRARMAGLTTLSLRYGCDPVSVEPATWDNGRVALYWNRTGLASPAFIEQFCAALRVDQLLYKNQLDPGFGPKALLKFPARIGSTQVTEIPHTERRDDYFALIRPANILLAPRAAEGIGMTFLEALARGCAVFACDRPTMNEVIESGVNGVLLPLETTPALVAGEWRMEHKSRRMLARFGVVGSGPLEVFSTAVDWAALAALDLERIGERARLSQAGGVLRWRASLPAYARFLLGGEG